MLSMLSLMGVTLGVMIPIIAMSILYGLQDHVKIRLAAFQGEVVIKALPRFGKMNNLWITNSEEILSLIKQHPAVQNAYPCYVIEGIFVSQDSWKPVSVHGVPLEFLQTDPTLQQYYAMVDGTADIQGIQRVNIGVELGRTFGLRQQTRARLLLLQKENLTLTPTDIPIKITGIFKTGLLEYDHSMLFTSIETLQRFLNQPQVATEIRVRIVQKVPIDAAVNSLQTMLLGEEQNLGVFVWQDFHKNLLLSLEVESLGIWIVMFFILLVSVFNIVGSQTLLITEKKREIGILKTMGVTPEEIRNIFLTEGLLMTGLGSILGGTFGCLISKYINGIITSLELSINRILRTTEWISGIKINELQLIPQGVYYLEGIPVSLRGETVLWVVCGAMLLTVFASIFPSIRAARESVISSIQSQE